MLTDKKEICGGNGKMYRKEKKASAGREMECKRQDRP